MRYKEARSDVGEGRYLGEAALPEHLEDHPGVLVPGDHGCVARSKDGLDDKRKDDLLADVLDFVDQGRKDPASDDSGEVTWDLSDSNLNWLVRVHVESCLGCQCSNCLLDHAGDEENDQMDREFLEHGEEMVREDWILGNGEVVDETADENESANGNSGGN